MMLEWIPAREWEKHKDARGLLSVAEKSKQPEEKLVLDSVAR